MFVEYIEKALRKADCHAHFVHAEINNISFIFPETLLKSDLLSIFLMI